MRFLFFNGGKRNTPYFFPRQKKKKSPDRRLHFWCISVFSIPAIYTLHHHFHLDYNVPCLSLPTRRQKKKIINFVTILFDFSWDDCNTQEKLETMVIQDFWG